MKQIWNGIQAAFTALGGFLGWFLGGVDGFLYALIAFVVIDYITGVLCAISDKNLSSEVGFKGICRKVLIFTLVGIGNILDVYVLGGTGGSANGGHFLLPFQRGCEPVGKRRAPGPADPRKAERSVGAAA